MPFHTLSPSQKELSYSKCTPWKSLGPQNGPTDRKLSNSLARLVLDILYVLSSQIGICSMPQVMVNP